MAWPTLIITANSMSGSDRTMKSTPSCMMGSGRRLLWVSLPRRRALLQLDSWRSPSESLNCLDTGALSAPAVDPEH